jgi:hypothetical protein
MGAAPGMTPSGPPFATAAPHQGLALVPLELNLGTSGTHPWNKLGIWGIETAQVERKWERV